MNSLAIRALVIVMLLLSSYQFGRHVKTGEIAEEQRRADKAIADLKQEKQDLADLLTAVNTAKRTERIAVEKTIIKEVTAYVEVTPADQRCTLPGTWRVRHDAAATGVPASAEAGSLAIGSAGPVEDAAALATVADNYATARECAEKLAGWRDRYRKLER